LALKSIEDGFSKGIRYYVGPQSSAEVAAVRNYAETNNNLVVSQGSTASNLAIANDAIFRLCPGDSIEGAEVAKTLAASSIKYLITASRSDDGNIGLQRSVGSAISNLGGVVVDSIPPYSTTESDFTSFLSTLKSKITSGMATYGAKNVGVYLASFDECVNIFDKAKPDSVFSMVTWSGGDGVVLSSTLTTDTLAASFAYSTHFFAPNFGLPSYSNPDMARLVSQIYAKTGIEPDAYALSSYDATWVLAQSIISDPSRLTDFQELKNYFLVQCNHYYGITGPLLLNAAGDRENGTFDYWGISPAGNSSYQWIWVGKSQ
jgi:branched-chain amino acid transport system substrate-binding protein